MIAFIHIEKTAGNTVTSILRRSLGTGHCEARIWRRSPRPEPACITPYDLRCSRLVYWRLRCISGHLVRPSDELADVGLWFFTFLREPLARCASHYQFQVQRMGCTLPFNQWIDNPGYHNLQTRRIAGGEDVDLAIERLQGRIRFVGLVERFPQSLIMLQQRCPLPLDIRHRPCNMAADNSIKDRLLANADSRTRLLQANRLDLQLYRYAFDDVFARQLSAHEGDVQAAAYRLQRECRRANRSWLAARPPVAAITLRHLLYRPMARLCSGSWWY